MCDCDSRKQKRPNITAYQLVLRCVQLCAGYVTRVAEQLRGEDGSCQCDRWLPHEFLPLGESDDHAPRYNGSARLGKCIGPSKGVSMQLKNSFTSPAEILFELFFFIHSTFSG